MKPVRIQRKRTRGWRMPPNTVCVSRPGKWGNPFRVGKDGVVDRPDAVAKYLMWLGTTTSGAKIVEAAKTELRGKNLACYCGDGPCHADVLLEISNSVENPNAK